jgi:hypothetical protein
VGIQVQPCCCGVDEVYRFTGFRKYRKSEDGFVQRWQYAGPILAGYAPGADVDLKNGLVFGSTVRGVVRRYRTRDAGDIRIVATRPPGTVAHGLTEFRVYPDRELVLFTEMVTSTSSALVLMDYAGSMTDLRTLTGSTAVGSSLLPFSGCINLLLNKVVFIEAERTSATPPIAHTIKLRQCDLDGTNLETLHDFGPFDNLQTRAMLMADVDYQHARYFVTEGLGLFTEVTRNIYSISWDGTDVQSVLTGDDITPYFAGTPLDDEIWNVGFFDGQINDDKRWWFRGFMNTEPSGTESQWFSMEFDGSDLQHEFAQSIFPDFPAITHSDSDSFVFGAGYNNRRGREPSGGGEA